MTIDLAYEFVSNTEKGESKAVHIYVGTGSSIHFRLCFTAKPTLHVAYYIYGTRLIRLDKKKQEIHWSLSYGSCTQESGRGALQRLKLNEFS